MNDMIGSAGMLRGWGMLWHTEIMWVLPTFVVAVAFVAMSEFLASIRGLHLPLRNPQFFRTGRIPAIAPRSIATGLDRPLCDDSSVIQSQPVPQSATLIAPPGSPVSGWISQS